MDLARLKLPAGLVVTAVVGALGAGAAWALTKADVSAHGVRIEKLEGQREKDREALIRIDERTAAQSEVLKRIEDKLEARP